MANTVTLEAELRAKLNENIAQTEVTKLQKTVDKISMDKSFNIFAKKYEKLANMKIKGFQDFEKQQQGLEQLEQVFGETRTKDFKSAISSGAKAESGGAMEGIVGTMSKGLQGILSIGTKIFAGVGIAVAIMKVFQPAANMLNSITKLLAEFFRPLGVMVQVLLQPVLQLLRPILMVFRTMMAPYMQAALKLSRDATKDIMQGLEGSGVIKSLLAMDTLLIGLEYAIVKGTWQTTKILVDALFTIQKTIIKVVTMIGSSIVGGLGILINKTTIGNSGNVLIGAAGSIAATGGIVTAGVKAQRDNFFELGDALIDKFFDAAGNSIEKQAAKFGTEIDIPDRMGATWEEVFDTFTNASIDVTKSMFGKLEVAWSKSFQDDFIHRVDNKFGNLFSELGETFDGAYNDAKSSFDAIITKYWTDLAETNQRAMEDAKKQTVGLTSYDVDSTFRSIGNKRGSGMENATRSAMMNDDKDTMLALLGIKRPDANKLKEEANTEVYEKLIANGYNSLADATLSNMAEGGKVYQAYDKGFVVLKEQTQSHFTEQSKSWESMYGPNGTLVTTTKRGTDAQIKSIQNVNTAALMNVSITRSAVSSLITVQGRLDNALREIERSSKRSNKSR